MHSFTRGDTRVAWRTQRACGFTPASVFVCVLALCGAVACDRTPIAAPPPDTLSIGVALPRTGTQSIGVSGFLSLLTSEPLVSVGWDGRPTRKLVEEWGALSKGHGIWLRLHPNVRTHDGTALTASRIRDILKEGPANQSTLSYSSITDVVAVDERTLEIRLSRPEAFLLSDLAETTIARTGPYRLVEQKERVRLEAFQDYYRGRPQTSVVEVKQYGTQRNTWAALMRGEINAVHEVSPAAIEFVEQATNVRTYPFLRAYYTFLTFNMSHPVLSRASVRQALSEAIDREKIVKLALRGRGRPADGPIWPFHWAYSTGQRVHSYNPEAARLRLDAADFRMPNRAEPGRMPSRLRFNCLIWTNDARFESVALIMQKQLFDIGVDMTIEAVPVPEFVTRMVEGRFDTLLMEYASARSLGWVYGAFHSSHPIRNSPRTGYTAADHLLDRLRGATEDQQIRETVGELQRTFYEDPPAIFISWPNSSRAVSTTFTVPQETNPDVLGSMWRWTAQPQIANR